MIDKAATTDTTKGFMSDDPSDLPQASSFVGSRFARSHLRLG